MRSLPARTLGEWTLHSSRPYANPFTDLRLDASFTGPSGQTFTLPGFFDGNATWRVRFNPDAAGRWRYRISAQPADPGLTVEGEFEVTLATGPGFLRATPGEAWGFRDEAGDPVFIFGDTVYNLFGMAYCGVDVVPFLRRRAEQGFNFLRCRLPMSLYHPPEGFNQWMDRRIWPWGGSETVPLFDRFNLDYFAVVDAVMREIEALGLRVELIMEGWGFEFPYNNRQVFLPEWEELWMRYLIARYDAFTCVASWTPLNEYEYYPDGIFRHTPVADRWAMRIGRWIKSVAQHGHLVTAHNGPRLPPFAERFATDPGAIDAILFQDWGSRGETDGWLTAGLDDQIAQSLAGWTGSAVLAEYGYEVNPELPLLIPAHQYCDADHTRRGAWRGAFSGLGIIHGFDNSWGMHAILDRDQPGLAYLLHVRRFFTEFVPFAALRPAPDLIAGEAFPAGRRPLALATPDRSTVAAYLTTGGAVRLNLPADRSRSGRWFDPRTGAFARRAVADETGAYAAPGGGGERPFDWVLVLDGA
jgi:hypothetical protein